jgi:hypothetical protein
MLNRTAGAPLNGGPRPFSNAGLQYAYAGLISCGNTAPERFGMTLTLEA